MNTTITKEIEIELEGKDGEYTYEDFYIEIDYYLGSDNRNSGEMVRMNGRMVRGLPLDPPEYPELEVTDVIPKNPNFLLSEKQKTKIMEGLDEADLWDDIEKEDRGC